MPLSTFKVCWDSFDIEPGRRELFLSYTPSKLRGPGIDRDGLEEPRMVQSDAPWNANVTSPGDQRQGTWRVGEPNKPDPTLQKSLASTDWPRQDWAEPWPDTTHCDYFHYLTDNAWDIEAAQGCGNLTMNLWFVAWYMPSDHYSGRDDRRPGLVFLPDEARLLSGESKTRASDRKYSCLVKWRSGIASGQMSIADLRFDPFDDTRAVALDASKSNVTKDVEFAVFGQQVIRDGEVVDLGTIADQFADVRHLLKLPNMKDILGPEMDQDFWLGENQLIGIKPGDYDRRRGALSRPVYLEWKYFTERQGLKRRTDDEWRVIIKAALELKGYRFVPDRPPQQPGEFRFEPGNTKLVDVWLVSNPYPWTFVGLGKPDASGRSNKLIFMATSGSSGQKGLPLSVAIEKLRNQADDVHNALLIDEGVDVFQYLKGSKPSEARFSVRGHTYNDPRKRDRMRAIFILGRKSKDTSAAQPAAQP